MNKNGQIGAIGAIILFLIFLVNWFIWLGSWLNTVGTLAVTGNNLIGIEAFVFNNLNFAVLIIVLLAMMAWTYFSSG